jgi:hypothetical protein
MPYQKRTMVCIVISEGSCCEKTDFAAAPLLFYKTCYQKGCYLWNRHR